MNAKTYRFDLKVYDYQIAESVQALFHTIFMNRVHGKLICNESNKILLQSNVAFEDVDCKTIDLRYIRVKSAKLVNVINENCVDFVNKLRWSTHRKGEINLEFMQKRTLSGQVGGLVKLYESINNEPLTWEKWTVDVEIVTKIRNQDDEGRFQKRVVEMIEKHILTIAQTTCDDRYLPKIQKDLQAVFDTTIGDLSPYLFKISHSASSYFRTKIAKSVNRILFSTS